MSTCRIESYTIPSAGFGGENPSPDIKNVTYIHAGIDITDAVPAEDRQFIGKGMQSTLLPYRVQDGYDRRLHDRKFQAVVLENAWLRAVILPELGGRLWSLTDKETGRELLYRNPVFQPCNMALRNAWFSGGVEFNVSIKGHSPLTCSPLFARQLTFADGAAGVRLYEYERIRGVAYSIDIWIPKDSHMLYVRPRIENRRPDMVWMYWWSNIAVPEQAHMRVIVPADEVLVNYFGNDHYVLDKEEMPRALGTDVSYPDRLQRSLDFFYRIPEDSRKWIAAVGQDGYGLLQCSTRELRGRKLFVWGQGSGGRNWNRFLCQDQGGGYVEIQAGLARTQLEHLPMPAGEVWTWTEAYGAVRASRDALHGDWDTARQTIEEVLTAQYPDGLQDTLERYTALPAQPGDWLWMGSGWGALEEMRRRHEGEAGLSDACAFPENAIQEEQREWVTLLEEGYLPERPPQEAPLGYLVDEPWRKRLRAAVKSGVCSHWYAWLQLGVMEYAAGHLEESRICFEHSVNRTPNAWACRNLAMLYGNEFADRETACMWMRKAIALKKENRNLLMDAAAILLAAGYAEEWLTLYDSLEDGVKKDNRLRYACVKAYMMQERYFEAASILNSRFELADVKEGDTSLSDTWKTLYEHITALEAGQTEPQAVSALAQERYPLGHLDFRIH